MFTDPISLTVSFLSLVSAVLATVAAFATHLHVRRHH
jgi:hypothetical protein